MPAVDEKALNAFLGQIVSDLGASLHVLTVVIGDKLGHLDSKHIQETRPAGE